MLVFVMLWLPQLGTRLIVATSFDREMDMAHIKINESAGVADRIIFSEGTVTQSGYPRSPRLQLLQSLYPHIETYITECKQAVSKRDYELGWGCEGAPRKAAENHACRGESDSTVVVLSDADEILSERTLKKIKASPPPLGFTVSFSKTMSVHIYGFFWQEPGRRYSTASARTCGSIRSGKKLRSIDYPIFSGWHCSYCFPVDEYLSKMHNMLKGDGWLSLSDHYWSLETLWSFRQHGLPLNGQKKMSPADVAPPRLALETMPYLIKNTALDIKPPVHPFKFPSK